MRSLVRILACTVLALGGWHGVLWFRCRRTVSAFRPVGRNRGPPGSGSATPSQREARLRWEYERRRSAAHARMPNTLYASTPSNQAHGDLACPVPVDDDARRLYRKALTGQGPSAGVLNAPDLFRSGSSSQAVLRAAGSGFWPLRARGRRTPSPGRPGPRQQTARPAIRSRRRVGQQKRSSAGRERIRPTTSTCSPRPPSRCGRGSCG